jgi:hypothetical protein
MAFIKRLASAAQQAGLEPLQGHGIRIGATLFYLLLGMPIEAMKVMGRSVWVLQLVSPLVSLVCYSGREALRAFTHFAYNASYFSYCLIISKFLFIPALTSVDLCFSCSNNQ